MKNLYNFNQLHLSLFGINLKLLKLPFVENLVNDFTFVNLNVSTWTLDKKSTERTWQEFTQETSMHGIRYVQMKEAKTLRRYLSKKSMHSFSCNTRVNRSTVHCKKFCRQLISLGLHSITQERNVS